MEEGDHGRVVLDLPRVANVVELGFGLIRSIPLRCARIDITTLAINLVKRRIEKMYPEKALAMTVEGYPADLAGALELFHQDPFEFEYWCCDLVNARPAGDKRQGKMKGADRGIDGVITFIDMNAGKQEYRQLLVQVKGGHASSPQARDFRGTIEREKAAGGVFISLEAPTKPMLHEAVEAGTFTYQMTGQRFPVMQFLTVEDLLSGKRPQAPNVVGYARHAPAATAVPEQGTLAGMPVPTAPMKKRRK